MSSPSSSPASSDPSANLSAKDIILVDATVISGILILLTISSFSQFEFPNRSVFVSAAVPIVGLFAISSFFALENKISYARKFAKGGFVAIVLFMIFIGTVNIGIIVAPDMWRESPIAEKIVSNSTSSTSARGEGAKHSTTVPE
jgi:energy-converting hydrogenase Eha subunit H